MALPSPASLAYRGMIPPSTDCGPSNTVDGICIPAESIKSYIVETDEGHTLHTREYVTIIKEIQTDVVLDGPDIGSTVLTDTEDGQTINTVYPTTVLRETEADTLLEGNNESATTIIDTRD